MRSLIMIAVVGLGLLMSSSSFAAQKQLTIIYNASSQFQCWPPGSTCLHVLTINYNTALIAKAFTDAGISVPAGETMGYISQGADQGDFDVFTALNLPASTSSDNLPFNVLKQTAVWSDEVGGYLIYFDENAN
jgi:hypothetical protein